jgi:hypothetical protein
LPQADPEGLRYARKDSHLMSAARTSPGSSVSHQPPQHAPNPGPGGHETQAIDIQDIDELPSRLADAIDDRIAEILDELLAERMAMPHRRLLHVLGLLILILALPASALLWPHTPASWTIWAATATVCLVITWATKAS